VCPRLRGGRAARSVTHGMTVRNRAETQRYRCRVSALPGAQPSRAPRCVRGSRRLFPAPCRWRGAAARSTRVLRPHGRRSAGSAADGAVPWRRVSGGGIPQRLRGTGRVRIASTRSTARREPPRAHGRGLRPAVACGRWARARRDFPRGGWGTEDAVRTEYLRDPAATLRGARSRPLAPGGGGGFRTAGGAAGSSDRTGERDVGVPSCVGRPGLLHPSPRGATRPPCDGPGLRPPVRDPVGSAPGVGKRSSSDRSGSAAAPSSSAR
jgi:hypothetical protein